MSIYYPTKYGVVIYRVETEEYIYDVVRPGSRKPRRWPSRLCLWLAKHLP